MNMPVFFTKNTGMFFVPHLDYSKFMYYIKKKKFFTTLLNPWLFTCALGVFSLMFFVFSLEPTIFRTYLEMSRFLNLTPPNGTLVFFLAMTMASTDGLILLCLIMFNTIKASRSVHTLVLLNNVLAVIAAFIPLSWEANTDSSVAMFALYDNTLAFWAYAFTLGLLLSVGSAWLIQSTRVSYVVAVQTVCLVFSDVPMFIAGFFGLPIGVLTNTCVNIFVAGLGVKLSQRYASWVRTCMQDTKIERFIPNQKTDIVLPLFSFLASSRLISWALASVYGPTNTCASIEPRFACVLFCILCVVWLYASGKLLVASLNPTIDERFVPFEPVLVYSKLVHPYVVLFCAYINVQKLTLYRKILRKCKRGLKTQPKITRAFASFITQRLTVLNALLRYCTSTEFQLTSPWLTERENQLLVLYMTKIPVTKTTAEQTWKFLGVLPGLLTTVGLGVASLENIQVQQAAQDFKSESEEVTPALADIDKTKLDPENREVVDRISETNDRKTAFAAKAPSASMFNTHSMASEGLGIRGRDAVDKSHVKQLIRKQAVDIVQYLRSQPQKD